MSIESSEFQPMFIRFRGRVQGPFGFDQLLALHRRGQFGRAHEVSVDRQTWSSAALLESVFPAPISKPKPMAKAEDVEAAVVASTTAARPAPKPAKPVWHYSLGTEDYGPITLLELRGLLANGQLTLSDSVWREGMDDWAAAGDLPELRDNLNRRPTNPGQRPAAAGNYCFACGAATDSRAEICPKCGVRQTPLLVPKSRVVTALFAIFLGTFGIHRFYLGQALLGMVYPIMWCVFLTAGGILAKRAEYDVAAIMLGLSSLPGAIAVIEGIVFLCTSDSSFAKAHKPT